ncbi:hypothetical protein GCM10027346_16970 [Hymenobacter seoulensis]
MPVVESAEVVHIAVGVVAPEQFPIGELGNWHSTAGATKEHDNGQAEPKATVSGGNRIALLSTSTATRLAKELQKYFQ